MSLKDSFRGLYRLCKCGCKTLIRIMNKHGRIKHYEIGHYWMGKFGIDNKGWKGGRYKDNHGYWTLNMPHYFSANSFGKVREHIYNFQEYHKCCMLKWGVIHHIDENKENNMPWNLQGMMWAKHSSIHQHNRIKDKSDRFCLLCDRKAYVDKNGHENWVTYKDGWICNRCRDKIYYRKNKEAIMKQKTLYRKRKRLQKANQSKLAISSSTSSTT